MNRQCFLAICPSLLLTHSLRRALTMNRWTKPTAMLSSLIPEKTVKKGAPFSHTPSFIFRLCFVQSGGPDKANNGIPLHVQLPSSSAPSSFPFIHLSFFASHLILAITMTATCPPPPLLIYFLRHQHSLTSPNLLSCQFKFDETI